MFDLDRASLLTEIVVRVIRAFHLDLSELHNGSTTVAFSGACRAADGRVQRGQPTVSITFGKNKDHRPDLRLLLWNLTATVVGMVPIHYRVYDVNTDDSPTDRDSWTTVRGPVGPPGFLYVADSKPSSEGTLQRIVAEGGRFLTVCPRVRKEDGPSPEWVQDHPVEWAEVDRREMRWGEHDVWRMADDPAVSGVPTVRGARGEPSAGGVRRGEPLPPTRRRARGAGVRA